MAAAKKPLTLAIIIPVYNDRRHLNECLESIERQTVKPDEVIVVNNNSTDGSEKSAKKFPFVRVINEPKQGIVHARNRGFDSAKTNIIGRIDADSVLPEDWVERITGFFADSRRKNHAWTGGGVFRNTYFPRFYGWAQSQVAFRFNRLLMGHYILWGSNMAIRSEHWHKVKNATCLDNDIHEDLDLAMHLHDQGVLITYQAYVKVNVVMRRLYRPAVLKENLMLWPQTLKKHGKKTWVFGWLGAQCLYGLRHLVRLASNDKTS